MNSFNVGDTVEIKALTGDGWKKVLCVVEEDVSLCKIRLTSVNTDDNGYILRPIDGSVFDHGRFKESGQHWSPTHSMRLVKRGVKQVKQHFNEELFVI